MIEIFWRRESKTNLPIQLAHFYHHKVVLYFLFFSLFLWVFYVMLAFSWLVERHFLQILKIAIPIKISLQSNFSCKIFHSETILGSIFALQRYNRYSKEVAFFHYVCLVFTYVQSCNRKVAKCPIIETTKNFMFETNNTTKFHYTS